MSFTNYAKFFLLLICIQIFFGSYSCKHVDPDLNFSEDDLKLDEELAVEEESNKKSHLDIENELKKAELKRTMHSYYRKNDVDDEFEIPEGLDEKVIPEHLKDPIMGKHTRRPPNMDPHLGKIPQSIRDAPQHRHPHHPPPHGGPGGIPGNFNSIPPEAMMHQPPPTSSSQGDPNAAKPRFELSSEIEVVLDISSLVLFLAFILNLMIGKIQGFNFLEFWNRSTKDFFVKNYAHVGFTEELQYDMPFMKLSNSEFKFYASGRKNVSCLLADFYLIKRYNIFHRLFGFDVIKYRIWTDYQVPFVMCINDKKQNKLIRKKHLDIGFFTEIYPDEVESSELGLQTEDLGIYKEIFQSPSLKAKYQKLQKYLIWLYISDRKRLNKFETHIVVTFNLRKDADLINTQMEFIHELVEVVKQIKIPKKKYDQLSKTRDEFQNKLLKEIERSEQQRPVMKTQRQSKQSMRDNKKMQQEEDNKKIIRLTPPPMDFKNK